VLVRGAPIHHGDFPLFAPELTEGVFDAMVEATHAARGRGAAAVPRAPRCVVVTSATMFTPGGFEQLIEATSVIAPEPTIPPPDVTPPDDVAAITRRYGTEILAS
jgi:hypothetical protein